MGVPIGEARKLTLWEYEAILTEHNRRQPKQDTGAPIEPPSRERVKRNLERLANDPRYTGAAPVK